MADQSFQEKTELASPKKKEDSRKKGQVAKSQELNSAVIMSTSIILLYFLMGNIMNTITSIFKAVYKEAGTFEISEALAMPYLEIGLNIFTDLVAPIALTIMMVGVLTGYAQVGSIFSIKAITPKWEKISLTKGIKRMFSQRSLIEGIKSVFKLSIVGIIGYLTISASFDEFISLSEREIGGLISFIGSMILKISVNITIALIFLAVADFSYQRWRHNKDLMMTKQEVKEEFKQMEGDPLIKQRIRSLQRDSARKRMLQEVPEADVIITNPTTYAVALKYDISTMSAPKVIAKGVRKIAEKIKEIASEHDIPIVENKWLARALYESAQIGEETPYELFKAVAEVLAYVYKLQETE